MKHKNIGDSFDSFLEEEGIREAVEMVATKRIVALQLQEEMNKRNVTKTSLARKMGTSRSSLNRLLDPEDEALTFRTLKRAAHALGKGLRIELI
jgi:antitoxin HicB